MEIVRVVKMTFREEEIPAFIRFFEEKRPDIRNFPGCSHLELWQDRLHHHIFFTYSIWASESALESYRNSEFFKATWSATKPLFAGKPEAWSVRQI